MPPLHAHRIHRIYGGGAGDERRITVALCYVFGYQFCFLNCFVLSVNRDLHAVLRSYNDNNFVCFYKTATA